MRTKLIVGFAALLVVGLAMCWFGLGVCDTNTLEAPGFSESAFSSLRPGMTREQVASLAGKPLGEKCDSPADEEWRYGSLREPRNPTERGAKWISFGKNGQVSTILGDPAIGANLLPGMQRQQVESVLGNPRVKLPRRPCVMYFTAAKEDGNDTFRVRQLSFDEEGHVVDVVAYRLRD
jgi:outer membrane protein assembly factor BamE (lipoprotein component of BamABCDE complex)